MTNRGTLQRVATFALIIGCCVVLAGCQRCTCGVAGKTHQEEQVAKQDAAATPYWSPPPKTAAEQSAALLAALEKSTGFSLELMNVPCTLEKERHSASVGAPMEKYTQKTRKTFYVPGDPFGPGGKVVPIKCVHNKNQPSFSFSGKGVTDALSLRPGISGSISLTSISHNGHANYSTAMNIHVHVMYEAEGVAAVKFDEVLRYDLEKR